MKPINNFPGYSITENGKIWSHPRRWNTGFGIRKHSGKWLKTKFSPSGHENVGLYKNNKIHYVWVHRLVLETYVGPCPDGMEACHNDGNPADNRLENLRWDTRRNNHRDKVQHGTHNRGERHGRVKLNELQVRVIRRLIEFGNLTRLEIAKVFNVNDSTIGDIKAKRTWGWL